MRIKIAIRNTFRNSRRTALNVFMVAAGVTSIVMFKGFSSHMLLLLREETINADFGHLQIARQAHWEQSAENPKDNLLPDHARLLAEIGNSKDIAAVSGRITFFGLAGNRDRSMAVRVLSFDSEAERHRTRSLRLKEGKPLSGPEIPEILVGSGVARQLKARTGESLTVLGYTYDNVINALDMEVTGVFQSGMSEIDNSTVIMSLKMAQKLLDTQSVEKIVVHLKDTERTDFALSALSSRLLASRASAADSPAAGAELKIKPWHELATLYNEVASFYRSYDRVIQAIILTLVLISILNTIGMSIFERTGEIGTMRALGETEGNVIRLFVLEGAVLGILGCLTGTVSAFAFAHLVNAMKIPLVLPNATVPVPIGIALPARNFLEAMGMALLTAVIAAAIPAYRATRLAIVDALRRNI